MSENESPDVKAELAALRAEVEHLRARQDETSDGDPWKGLKEYSKAIEEGRINEFLYDRSAPAWVLNLGWAVFFAVTTAFFIYFYIKVTP